MATSLMKLYHRLPLPLRQMAIYLYGLKISRWRYSSETARMVDEALQRDYWTPEQWKVFNEEKLAYVLDRAARQVPYYREQWSKRRQNGDRASWEYLENWPILEKSELRSQPKAFLVDGVDLNKLQSGHTSGSTGKPLSLWWTRDMERFWYALSFARMQRWSGITSWQRWANIGGRLIVPVERESPPFWMWNAHMEQLYMSSYHLSPRFMSSYLDALKSYKIRYLVGYTSSIYELALHVLRTKRSDLTMLAVFPNAEPVAPYQREAIERAFQCKVRETYGMGEAVACATECEQGHMHVWPEAGWIEVVNGDKPVQDAVGDLVCTGFANMEMMFVRYRVGDRAKLAPPDAHCDCGRTLPIIETIEGRLEDRIYTLDGRRIGRLHPVFTVFQDRLALHEAQIIQDALDHFTVRYVPAQDFSPSDSQAIIDNLRACVGNVQVSLVRVDQIPRLPNGKFRVLLCNLPDAEKARLDELNLGSAS